MDYDVNTRGTRSGSRCGALSFPFEARVVWVTEGKGKNRVVVGAEVVIAPPPSQKDFSVHAYDFSVRTSNCLYKAGIATFSELAAHTATELSEECGHAFNIHCLMEIKQALKEKGLKLTSSRGGKR